jgi:hypothetical protein
LSTFRGIPVIWLVTLDGLPIVKGDSGGGVWFDGRLVANLWASPYVVETGARTSRGFAALIPAEGFSGSSHNPVDTDVDNQQISP